MSDDKEIGEAIAKSLNETTRDEEQHEIVQNWADTIYDATKKLLTVSLGLAFLVEVVSGGGLIELIKSLYRISLEYGRMEYLAPTIAILIVGRILYSEFRQRKRSDQD